jgi:predicted phage terminase large subunit-like protein
MNGDWSVREEGLIRPEWLRMYQHEEGRLLLCDATGMVITSCEPRSARRLVTIDPAGTSEDRARERRGHVASWSVVQAWDVVPLGEGSLMLLREQWRERVGFDGLCHRIRAVYDQWRPHEMWIENEKLGQAAVDLLGDELPIDTIATKGADKVARAAPLLHKLERGEVFFPRYATWKGDFEAELLAWSGDPEEPSDQIDAAAYAARLVVETSRAARPVRVLPVW